ncbi:MAG TPA: aldo/keto reductase [Bryobacteraceae bacterium]|nr:aldo/keto reductase [Bryobacteraceae bacterium]
MHATAEATQRYAEQHSEFRDCGFYREVRGLQVSSLGIGTYLGGADEATDRAYTEALIAAGESGINFFDCAINYRHQRSERSIGAALPHLDRRQIVVCTKAGFLTPGAVPDCLTPGDVVGRMHSMAPDFLEDQIARSRANLGVDAIDVFYLHNPETQLRFRTREQFEAAIRGAFTRLEELVARGWIRWYGAATWDGLRQKDSLSLRRLSALAGEAGGSGHHFRFIQLPFNLAMVEAFTGHPGNLLETAAGLDVTVVASATLMQTRVLAEMPEAVQELLPGLTSDAQRAIQFTRSTPGIAVALVGMSRREHVLDNLGVARVPPASRDQYLRLYR